MASLQAIKHRIHAVDSIKKITHAMELVATSKLRKIKDEYNHVHEYDKLLDETFENILSHLSVQEIKELFPIFDGKSNLYIVITGDLGLAGSYNSDVIKYTEKTIKKDDKLIIIGTKGINALYKKYKNQVINKFNISSKKTNALLSKTIMKIVYPLYKNKEIKKIFIIWNEYINNLNQVANKRQIFPLALDTKEDQNTKYISNLNSPIEFEPSAHIVLDESIPLYISAKIYALLSNARLSEMASRRSAMENATDNANDLIDNLNLKYNRKRQSKITQELNEIVAGADAV